jgi:hypothetical protein
MTEAMSNLASRQPWFKAVADVADGVDEGGVVGGGLVDLRDLRQAANKMARFPRGTRFYFGLGPEGTRLREQRASKMWRILDDDSQSAAACQAAAWPHNAGFYP